MIYLRKNLFPVFLSLAFLILNILDVVTTLKGIDYESNDTVLFLYENNLFILIKVILSSLIITGLLFVNKIDSKFLKYALIGLAMFITCLTGYVVLNNFYVLNHI